MVRYFDDYVQRQNIPLELGCEVDGIYPATNGWRLETSSGEVRSRAIVWWRPATTARPFFRRGRA